MVVDYSNEAPKPLPKVATELAAKINGYVDKAPDGDWRFEVPTSSHQLQDWGESMNNCISGYWYGMANGSKVLFAVYAGDKMTFNGEIATNAPRTSDEPQNEAPRLRQCVGHHNRNLTPEERIRMKGILKAMGVLAIPGEVTGLADHLEAYPEGGIPNAEFAAPVAEVGEDWLY